VNRRIRKRAAILALGYAAALAAVSLLPSGTGPLSGWDTAINPDLQNALHVPAYGVLAWLVSRAMGRRRFRDLALAAAASAALGGLLEWAQAAVPGRFGSVEDVLLNAIGAAAALPILLGLHKLGIGKEEATTGEAPSAASGYRP